MRDVVNQFLPPDHSVHVTGDRWLPFKFFFFLGSQVEKKTHVKDLLILSCIYYK